MTLSFSRFRTVRPLVFDLRLRVEDPDALIALLEFARLGERVPVTAIIRKHSHFLLLFCLVRLAMLEMAQSPDPKSGGLPLTLQSDANDPGDRPLLPLSLAQADDMYTSMSRPGKPIWADYWRKHSGSNTGC